MKEESKIAEAYLSEYSDTVEALPLELQRNYTLIRQLDETAEDIMKQVAKESEGLSSERMVLLGIEERRAKLERIGQLLNEVLKKGEEKFALAKSTYDTVDRHCTRLDVDLQKIEDEQLGPGRSDGTNNSQKKLKSAMMNNTVDKKRRDSEIQKPSVGRGRKRVKKNEEEEEDETTEGDTYLSTEDAIQHAKNAVSMSDLPIDPNEPLYCYCRQVSFGEMVACDNEACDIEWFHLECVGLTVSPKGKWYCKNCANEFKKKKKL